MGRFATTVEYYARCREPYPEAFFEAIAERVGLGGEEALLDAGCGPGLLAIGLARFAGSSTGIDPEPAMIAAARAAAESAGVTLALWEGRMEDYPAGRRFDLVTIGRALHWFDRPAALDALERLTSARACVVVCGASSVESAENRWLKDYEEACNAWSDDPERNRYRVKPVEWFAGSCFEEIENISVTHRHRLSMDDLIGRALSKSNTSAEVVGNRRAEFEASLRGVLEAHAEAGFLEEEVAARATIFQRLS